MSPVVVGEGELKYELVAGWEKLPDGWAHRDVAGVTTDEEGNVYLFCRGDHPVIVYDRDGKLVQSWGEGGFSMRTHGMYRSGQDLYLVDDGANTVGRYSLGGQLHENLGPVADPSDSGYDGLHMDTITHGARPYNRPTNAAVAPSGDIYVSDGYGNCRVHRFSAQGELISSWGEPGTGPGQFHTPHSVWVHTDGRVFVADRENDRIQIFSPEGGYLTEWTDVQRPQDIFIAGGRVYIGELGYRAGSSSHRRGPVESEEPGRLSICDLDGNVLCRWADRDPTKDGYFIAPHGLCVDDQGAIYMGEVTWTIGVSQGLAPADAHTFQKFIPV